MNTDTPVEVSTKKKRVRSPAYPYLDLESAIEKARIIYAVAAHYDVSDHLIFQGWEVSPTSSKAPRTLSALCDYGLLQLVNDEKSDGKERRFKLTSWALEIIRDKRPISPERDQLLQKAALTPALYSELWDKYESNIPSDEFLEHELIAVRNYNEKAVPKISRDFKNTMIFAKLIEPTQEPTLNSDQSNDSETHTVAEPAEEDSPRSSTGSAPEKTSPISSDSSMFTLSLPLSSGTGTLSVPQPLTPEDFSRLKILLSKIEVLEPFFLPPSGESSSAEDSPS